MVLERYETEITNLFRDEKVLEFQLQVESALVEANASVGLINDNHAKEIILSCQNKSVTLTRVKELESEVHHDIMALVLAISEQRRFSISWREFLPIC